MSLATVRLVDEKYLSHFYFVKDQKGIAKSLRQDGFYRTQGTMGVPGLEGEAVAEDIFDLTNSPYRQEEREELYGRGRSVSVGDIISVDGTDYLCASRGWERI